VNVYGTSPILSIIASFSIHARARSNKRAGLIRLKTKAARKNQHAGIIEIAAHLDHGLLSAVQAQAAAERVGERGRRLLFRIA